MGRGSKPAKGKAKPAVPRKARTSEDSKVRDLEKRLAEALGQLQTRDRELAEAREQLTAAHAQVSESLDQQTATSEILRVISSSPTDIQPVFDIIAANAARLCVAGDAQVLRVESDVLRLISAYGSPSMSSVRTISRGHAVGRAVIDRQTIHVRDMAQAVAELPETSSPQHGVESLVAVPLLRGDVAVGVIRVSRTQIQPFTEQQITLLKTFADQAVIAIENVRLFTALQEKNRALSESLEQQTATSAILRVISSSPTDIQPVFDTIIASAVKLCEAYSGILVRVEDGLIHRVAGMGPHRESPESVRRTFPRPLDLTTAMGQAILERRVVQLPDTESPTAPPVVRDAARAVGFRAELAVPMLRDGEPIGGIAVTRRSPGPFSAAEAHLLQTFADQAVIAIENVRLFTELQTSNRDLTTALDKETATSEILRVISSSPTDVQPVFDTIVQSAVRLCDGLFSALYQFDGELIHEVAQHNYTPEALEVAHRVFPTRPSPSLGAARAILERRVVHIPNVETEPEYQPVLAQAIGVRSGLYVPMLRKGTPIGVIGVARAEARPFSDDQIKLLETFADQATIAIENARLFKELEARNYDLTVALDRQTATAGVLRIIAQSPTELQPVLDAIAASAVRLCDASDAVIERLEGDRFYNAAHAGTRMKGLVGLPLPLTRGFPGGRAILDRKPVIVEDFDLVASEYPDTLELSKLNEIHSFAEIPLLSEGKPLGNLAILRVEVRPFTDAEIALLQTFADQAVIAIENVRLFSELQASNRDLTTALDKQTATSDILRVISQSQTDVQPVFDAIVNSAVRLLRAYSGALTRVDREQIALAALTSTDDATGDAAQRARYPQPLNSDSAHALAIRNRAPLNIADAHADHRVSEAGRVNARIRGYQSILVVPMLLRDAAVGAISVTRRESGGFSDDEIALLQTFADQAVIAIENVRLFKELEAANRELAAASHHKSEFLANMSHELRTPLNAIIGFSEVLSERMFGELNAKQEEYSKDIHASGQHLLSLINDILDLSKIEAGRMELELTEFDLPTAIDSAVMLVRERAGRRNIALHTAMTAQLGQIQADERKVRQVVLNLLSNAIKFTPEGGRIEVGAVPKDSFVEVSVSDTGIGIAPEDQETVFEEFRQVGTAAKKIEGTGLGLTLCRKFVELHGGKIWVKSQLGAGSTFTFTIPVRYGE